METNENFIYICGVKNVLRFIAIVIIVYYELTLATIDNIQREKG